MPPVTSLMPAGVPPQGWFTGGRAAHRSTPHPSPVVTPWSDVWNVGGQEAVERP